MDDKEKQPEKKSFSGKLGYFVGVVMASCLTAVVCSAVIALAVKIIVGLITWLF